MFEGNILRLLMTLAKSQKLAMVMCTG